MAISDTQTFNLEVGDIIEEAYERAGLKMDSAYDFRTGKRSIDLLMLEWQNRNIDIWMVEERYWSLNGESSGERRPTANTIDLTLDIGTVDVLDVVIRTGTSADGNGIWAAGWADSRLTRLSERAYATIPAKLTTGVPNSYYMKTHEILDTGSSTNTNAVISVYPAVNTSEIYNVLYWRTKRIADVGNSAGNTIEVPGQYLPALVSGLAYRIAMKRGESGGRLPALKADYDEQILLLGKSASPNDEGTGVQPMQQPAAQQQVQMVKSRDGTMRVSRYSSSRRM
jgi:hypothetical protein